jgi:hypothetical protein
MRAELHRYVQEYLSGVINIFTYVVVTSLTFSFESVPCRYPSLALANIAPAFLMYQCLCMSSYKASGTAIIKKETSRLVLEPLV